MVNGLKRGTMENITKLILKVRNGDNSAFVQLCEQYKALIESMSRKYVDMYPDKNGEEEDFIQEARLALYNAALKFNIEDSKVTFGAFAKACIRNRLISYLRRASSKKRRKCQNCDVVEKATPQDTVIQRELGEELFALAETILSKYELYIFKMYMSGAKAKEISARIDRDEKSINNAIFRIRSKLKRQSK